MRHPINELAITVSVGQFIKLLREAEENDKRIKPSMYNILLKNGVKSANRARQLIQRMIEHKVIVRHRDGSFTLTKKNWDSKELMPILLKRVYNKKSKSEPESEVLVVQEEIVNPLSYFEAKDLVAELRNRGYAVTCAREVITIETL
jgi:Fe-S oxidoreductase